MLSQHHPKLNYLLRTEADPALGANPAESSACAESAASLAAWMARNATGVALPWGEACDLGALLHGFLTRYGALFNCRRQAVSIEQARLAWDVST